MTVSVFLSEHLTPSSCFAASVKLSTGMYLNFRATLRHQLNSLGSDGIRGLEDNCQNTFVSSRGPSIAFVCWVIRARIVSSLNHPEQQIQRAQLGAPPTGYG